MRRRRHLLSFALALAAHAALFALLWDQARRYVPQERAHDDTPRLVFEVVTAPPAEDPAPAPPPPAPPAADPVARAVPASAAPVPSSSGVAPGDEGPPSPSPAVADAAPADGAAPPARASGPDAAPDLYGPAVGPHRAESWMARVLRGTGPRLADDEQARRLDPGRLPTDDERAAKIAKAWGTVKRRPDEVTEHKRVLQKHGDGYRYVDENTGEPLPEPPDPVGPSVPMFAEGGRRLSEGFTDEWARRPPKKKPRNDLVPTPEGGYRYAASGYTATILPDGEVVFDENLMSYRPGQTSDVSESLIPGFPGADYTSGTFDATDALMRLAGKDPYVTDKMRFLDETRDLRAEMRTEHRMERVEQALVQLRRSLDGTWNNWAKPEAERRRALFALWDECADDSAGTLARGFIETYIRAHLPEDSTVAFTADELAQFNQDRVSAARFDPYPRG